MLIIFQVYKWWLIHVPLICIGIRLIYQYSVDTCLPLPNVTWHSGTWPYTMTASIDQTLHQFANLLPNWTLIPILTLLPDFGGFHGALQRVWLANRGRLLLRTPGPVPFGTCICSNVEIILSWTCHVYGPFEFRTSLGTSILLLIGVTLSKFTDRCGAGRLVALTPNKFNEDCIHPVRVSNTNFIDSDEDNKVLIPRAYTRYTIFIYIL